MHTRARLALASVAATLLLALAIAGASANNLSTSAHRFRLTWASLELAGSEPVIPVVRCPVTLEGSFHSATLRKVTGALVGHVSRAIIAPCTNGGVTINQEVLPWHAQYQSFSGTLPNITGVTMRMIGSRWTFFSTAFGREIICTARSTAERPGVGILNVSSGTITGMRASETNNIPFLGPFPCETAGEAIFRGTASVMVLAAVTAITIRLI
jgi:hypothetical protein